MGAKKPKRRHGTIPLVELVGHIGAGHVRDDLADEGVGKNPAAASPGRLSAIKVGAVRRKGPSAKKRKPIAKKTATTGSDKGKGP